MRQLNIFKSFERGKRFNHSYSLTNKLKIDGSDLPNVENDSLSAFGLTDQKFTLVGKSKLTGTLTKNDAIISNNLHKYTRPAYQAKLMKYQHRPNSDIANILKDSINSYIYTFNANLVFKNFLLTNGEIIDIFNQFIKIDASGKDLSHTYTGFRSEKLHNSGNNLLMYGYKREKEILSDEEIHQMNLENDKEEQEMEAFSIKTLDFDTIIKQKADYKEMIEKSKMVTSLMSLNEYIEKDWDDFKSMEEMENVFFNQDDIIIEDYDDESFEIEGFEDFPISTSFEYRAEVDFEDMGTRFGPMAHLKLETLLKFVRNEMRETEILEMDNTNSYEYLTFEGLEPTIGMKYRDYEFVYTFATLDDEDHYWDFNENNPNSSLNTIIHEMVSMNNNSKYRQIYGRRFGAPTILDMNQYEKNIEGVEKYSSDLQIFDVLSMHTGFTKIQVEESPIKERHTQISQYSSWPDCLHIVGLDHQNGLQNCPPLKRLRISDTLVPYNIIYSPYPLIDLISGKFKEDFIGSHHTRISDTIEDYGEFNNITLLSPSANETFTNRLSQNLPTKGTSPEPSSYVLSPLVDKLSSETAKNELDLSQVLKRFDGYTAEEFKLLEKAMNFEGKNLKFVKIPIDEYRIKKDESSLPFNHVLALMKAADKNGLLSAIVLGSQQFKQLDPDVYKCLPLNIRDLYEQMGGNRVYFENVGYNSYQHADINGYFDIISGKIDPADRKIKNLFALNKLHPDEQR